MAGVNFNIELFDLSRRRKEQQALDLLESQRQQSEALRQSAFGTVEPGPPTRFGEQSVAGGQLAPNQFVEQLFGNQATADEGIKQTLALLEQQRKNEAAQNQQTQIQDALSGIPQNTAESSALVNLVAATGGENRDFAKALGQQLAPFTLGRESTRFTGAGEPIVAGGNIPGGLTDDPVQQSVILSDGTVQIVRRSGVTEVVTPEQENIEKIKAARRFGAEIQGLRASERGAGKNAQSQSLEAFKKIPSVREGISLLDEGIKLLRGGAGTGRIESMFPSFKAASVSLDNIQGRLGLNVIQNTTFGALSEAELKFALSTALPTGLNEPDLIKWMQDKRLVMDKLANYLTDTALFLGTPGNTISDYLRQKKTQQFVNSPPPGFK